MENISIPTVQLCPNPANKKENHISTESHCPRGRKQHAGDTALSDTKCFAFPSQYFSRFGTRPFTATSPHWALAELPAVTPQCQLCPPLPHSGMVPEGFSFPPFRDCSRGFQSTLTALSWIMAPFVPVLALAGSMRASRVHPLEKLREFHSKNQAAQREFILLKIERKKK